MNARFLFGGLCARKSKAECVVLRGGGFTHAKSFGKHRSRVFEIYADMADFAKFAPPRGKLQKRDSA